MTIEESRLRFVGGFLFLRPGPGENVRSAVSHTELDLDSAGISTIIWATGYSFDFSWVKFPIFDEFGYPRQERGVTPQPGLYFVGLHWLHTIKSGLLFGVADDAAYVVEHIEQQS